MKYKIMREFPKAKIGNEIRIDKEWLTEYKTDDGNWVGINIPIPDLILLGWIEEMEPREWNIYIKNNGEYVSLCDRLNNIVLERKDNHNWDKIIKVREVLE